MELVSYNAVPTHNTSLDYLFLSLAKIHLLDDRGFETRKGLGFLFTTASRLALGRTQPPIQWAPGALSLGVKRPEREAEHSLPSSAEVKNMWSYTSTTQYAFMAWCSVTAQEHLYLYSVNRYDIKRCLFLLF
jgi:hypothetical protein